MLSKLIKLNSWVSFWSSILPFLYRRFPSGSPKTFYIWVGLSLVLLLDFMVFLIHRLFIPFTITSIPLFITSILSKTIYESDSFHPLTKGKIFSFLTFVLKALSKWMAPGWQLQQQQTSVVFHNLTPLGIFSSPSGSRKMIFFKGLVILTAILKQATTRWGQELCRSHETCLDMILSYYYHYS